MDIWSIVLIVLLSLTPGLEARASIPVGYCILGEPLTVFILSYIASSIPSIPLLYLLGFLEENIVNRNSLLKKMYSWSVSRVRNGLERVRRSRYIYLALSLYVAIPLPLTGVWTGSLIAYLLGLDKEKSIIAIFLGNLLAVTMITLAVLGVISIAYIASS